MAPSGEAWRGRLAWIGVVVAVALVLVAVVAWLVVRDTGTPTAQSEPPAPTFSLTPSPTPPRAGSPTPAPARSPTPTAPPATPEPPPGSAPEQQWEPSRVPSGSWIADVRSAGHPGYDRVVFEFDGTYVPAHQVTHAAPGTPWHSIAGDVDAVDGAAFLEVSLHGTSRFDHDADYTPVYTGPTRIRSDTTTVTEVVEIEDFEASARWVIGLDRQQPFTAWTLPDPSRLVIDIETPAPTPMPVDCTVAPERADFTVGATHECFPTMGERFTVWLGANTTPPGESFVPATTFRVGDVQNVKNIQKITGDPPTGWLGPGQWQHLLDQPPPPMTQVRTNGIGPLWFGMTRQQLDASALAHVAEGPSGAPPSVELYGVGAWGCFSDADQFYAVLVFPPATATTVEGIGTTSTVADLEAAFGQRLIVRTVQDHPEWTTYAVHAGPHGYAFFPGDDGMRILAGIRQEVDQSAGAPHGLCGL